METTLRDGTTWRSTSPITSLAHAAEWIVAAENDRTSDVVRIELKRYDDEPAPRDWLGIIL
jgi:hypothetical protein